MKSRSKELLSRSVAAMVSAIEIYNKPDFYIAGSSGVMVIKETNQRSKLITWHGSCQS
jgi:hypothetical protein